MSKDKYISGFKWLAIYQILGGLTGMLDVFPLLFTAHYNYVTLSIIFTGFLLQAFSAYCGISLFRQQTNSLLISLVCQCLQAVSIYSFGFFYQYVSGFSFSLMLESSEGFHVHFSGNLSLFSFQTGDNSFDRMVGFNMVALGIIAVLYHEIKAIAREKKNDLIDSIGS